MEFIATQTKSPNAFYAKQISLPRRVIDTNLKKLYFGLSRTNLACDRNNKNVVNLPSTAVNQQASASKRRRFYKAINIYGVGTLGAKNSGERTGKQKFSLHSRSLA